MRCQRCGRPYSGHTCPYCGSPRQVVTWLRGIRDDLWCLLAHWSRVQDSYSSRCAKCGLLWW